MITSQTVTFSTKIRTLNEFHARISTNQQPPSSAEILTTLRFFHQSLIGFLKEISVEPKYTFRSYSSEFHRASAYPSLNFAGVYCGITNLLDVFTEISGSQFAIGDAILDTIKALYIFLQKDAVEKLPYLIACQFDVLPTELDTKMLHLICNCLLPFTVALDEESASIPAIIMLVFQHTSDPSLHSLLVESLMALKRDVYKDMMLVLAKGTSESRIAAANLLFHYWPLRHHQILNRRAIQYRIQAWNSLPCQNINCNGKSLSSKKCYDLSICCEYGETSPPILLCRTCAEAIQTNHKVYPLCNPMTTVDAVLCQNKGCEAKDRFAIGTCFAEDCIRSHHYVPLRLCEECFDALHIGIAAAHIRHKGIQCAWNSDLERDIVEAVVKLLKETSGNFEGIESEGKRPKWLRQLEGGHSLGQDIDKMADERRMLSRFGIWIMASLCPPVPEAHPESIAYIMSMLFQWFATTSLLPNDLMVASLEQLKTNFASDWINLAISNHYEIYIETLLPNPPDYARVGGVWDKLSTKKEQIREGLNKLFSIMPYDVISLSTWNTIMPYWLQAMCELMLTDECGDMKILLSKIFEPDMCPLPFDSTQVYEFITERLALGSENEVNSALEWLHVLSSIEISIPLPFLLQAISKCAIRLAEFQTSSEPSENDLEVKKVAAHITIIDTIALQMELNKVNMIENSTVAEEIFSTFAYLLQKPFSVGEHSCYNSETDEFLDCLPCQQSVFVYQIVSDLMGRICPRHQVQIIMETDESKDEWKTQLKEDSKSARQSVTTIKTLSPTEAMESGTIVEEQKVESLETTVLHFQVASQHEPLDDLEFASILPAEDVEIAQAHATTLTETDCGLESCYVVTSSLIENMNLVEAPLSVQGLKECQAKMEFWDTSVGRYRFTIDKLPAQHRLIYSILSNFDSEPNVDVQFYMLSTIKYICLHCEALANARREHRGFLIWAQENLLIPKFWDALRVDRSQVAEIATQLIMVCITVPFGEEIFWKTVTNQFISDSWQQRFSAVEHMSTMCHMFSAAPISSNKVIQTSLSCGISYLILSVNDSNSTVSQRAILALQAMPSSSLKLMCLCLDAQFDEAMVDRALIISQIQILTQIVPSNNILSFDFFIHRFESLTLESQLIRSDPDKLAYIHDLTHLNPMSDIYQRKLSRARHTVQNSPNARSIIHYLRGSKLQHHLAHIKFSRPKNEANENKPNPLHVSEGSGGCLREISDEDNNVCVFLNRYVDLENPERHIVYMTISLFVTFLCKNKCTGDEKTAVKKQSQLFRYFYALIGYSHSEKCFTVSPRRLRKSAICNAFLAGFPEFLDRNLSLANQIITLGIQLLIYLPSQQRFTSDQLANEYSLAPLEISARHSWLNALILLLYKYRYDVQPMSDYVRRLILIVLCTLDSQVHVCGKINTSLRTNHKALFESSDSDIDEDKSVDALETKQPSKKRAVNLQEIPTIVYERTYSDSEPAKAISPAPSVISDEKKDDKLPGITEEERQNASLQHSLKQKKSRKQQRPTSLSMSEQLRCGFCNGILENYDEETISLCFVALETFLHREPAMAAPLLFKIIRTSTKLIDKPIYPWHDTPIFVPGNSRSVAKQMLRVLLHQMSSSGIFLQLFNTNIENSRNFWSTIAFSLANFYEFNPVTVIQNLLEDLIEDTPARTSRILFNLAEYIIHVPTDAYLMQWVNVVSMLDTFFRRLLQSQSEANHNPVKTELKSSMTIMHSVLHIQNFSTFKSSVSLIDAFSKWMTEAMHECKIDLLDTLSVCTACNRGLVRERDKQCLTRAIVFELIQAMKFKCKMNEHNYLTIAEFVLQDAGESISEDISDDQFNTSACEAIRPYITDILEFLSDLHVLAKLKKITSSDNIGGDTKASLARVVAIEMSRVKESRAVSRYIPWLTSPPPVTQSAPTTFADAVTNIRLLSWLLLGALHASQPCLPVPIEFSHYMADYIHFVLAGFADQSKLWTVYCEQTALSSNDIESKAFTNILDFWARVTPAILQLLAHSKVLADMVNLHFLNTMQALQQCNSAVLCQLSSMWQPILTAYHGQIPRQLRMKLDSRENQPSLHLQPLSQWLKGVRYKISQIELQTSAASPYYNV